jgi:thymidine phosphorylase
VHRSSYLQVPDWQSALPEQHLFAGEVLAVLHVNSMENLDEAKQRLSRAFTIGREQPSLPPLIYDVIRSKV